MGGILGQGSAPATNTMPISPRDDSVYYFNTTFAVPTAAAWSLQRRIYIDNNNVAYLTDMTQQPSGNTQKIMDNVRSVYQINYGGGYRGNFTRFQNDTYYFISTNNELWAVGNNRVGQIGDDTGLDRSEPVLVMKDVANLYFSSHDIGGGAVLTVYALKTDNSRWAWGSEVKNGQTAFAPVKIDDYFNHNQQLLVDHISMRHGNPEIHRMDLLPDWAVGFRVVFPEQYPEEIIKLLGGEDNIDSLMVEGDISNPFSRSYALTKNGDLWGWGYNNGRLGDGTRASRDTPVKIAENVKRILPMFFVTKSNDWFYYSDIHHDSLKPGIAFRNPLYVVSNQTWFTPDSKFVTASRGRDGYRVNVIIDDIKLPSIVRAVDGRNIAPKAELIVPRARP